MYTFFLPYPSYLHLSYFCFPTLFNTLNSSSAIPLFYFFYLLLHTQHLFFFSFIPPFHILLLLVIHLLYTLFLVQSQSTFAQTKPTQFCSLCSVMSAPFRYQKSLDHTIYLEISRVDGTGHTKHSSLNYVAYTTECAFLSKQESKRP